MNLKKHFRVGKRWVDREDREKKKLFILDIFFFFFKIGKGKKTGFKSPKQYNIHIFSVYMLLLAHLGDKYLPDFKKSILYWKNI